jgi:hypothetical protein
MASTKAIAHASSVLVLAAPRRPPSFHEMKTIKMRHDVLARISCDDLFPAYESIYA